MRLYYANDRENIDEILADGFYDLVSYNTDEDVEYEGVWLSDDPLVVLDAPWTDPDTIEVDVPEADALDWELPRTQTRHDRWFVAPSEALNAYPRRRSEQ